MTAAKDRIVGWLAWLLFGMCLALAGLAIVLAVKRGRPPGELAADILPTVTWTIAFSLVGAVIAARRPHHRLGWIFCVVGLSQGLVTFANEFAVYALWTAPGSLPGGPFMAWLTTWVWAGSAPVLLTFLPLLFPDGRLPSPRWRPIAWLSAVRHRPAAQPHPGLRPAHRPPWRRLYRRRAGAWAAVRRDRR